MFLTSAHEVHDFDLELLADVLAPLDAHLEAVCSESVTGADADAFGYFERAEHITGLGLVACQAYLTATYGFLRIPKLKALDLGPVHPSQRKVAAIINHAANYWKHHDEWVFEPNDVRRRRILEAFGDLGFPVDTDYPLSGILTELVSPQDAALAPLVGLLAVWRDDLRRFPA